MKNTIQKKNVPGIFHLSHTSYIQFISIFTLILITEYIWSLEYFSTLFLLCTSPPPTMKHLLRFRIVPASSQLVPIYFGLIPLEFILEPE